MRVISGKWKGRKLLSPVGQEVRPTSDRIKGAVFNMLRPRLEGACFVDLFAGSGGIGIEALSNGAKMVYFVERDKAAIALIKANLKNIDAQYEVLDSDVYSAAESLARRFILADIIYADPPYRAGQEENIIKCAEQLLKEDGVLLIEHGRDTEVPIGSLVLQDERHYGITAISTFRKPRIAAVTGTFDPFTIGHSFLVTEALKQFDKVYVVHLVNPVKDMKYPVEKRLELTKKSVEKFGERVIVESYAGLAADYCRMRKVNAIVRGFRNNDDLDYEKRMAEVNFNACGIKTLFFEAEHKEISSTEVRSRVDVGMSVDGYVAESIKKEL